MTAELQLLDAHLAGGLERVTWWNGRVLTAEDMADHQRAVDGADRRLGRAVGAGVVRGLRVAVRSGRSSVSVTAGLAVDAAGEVLELPAEVVVHLVRPSGAPAAGSPADFVCCEVAPSSATLAGTGVYLLTIASAAGTSGTAPAAGTSAAPCGPRYEVAGVQFRLLEVDIIGAAAAAGHDDADLAVLGTLTAAEGHPRLRNVLAHVLLGSRARARALLDPFGAAPASALDVLTGPTGLLDCEVPLAVVVWAGSSVDFTDTWAVRRPPAPAGWTPQAWASTWAGPPAEQLGLVALRQLAEHLGDLLDPPAPASAGLALEARETFRYLPAAALVPHRGAGAQRGVDLAVFLAGLDARGGPPMAAGRVWPMLTASITAPVVDLDADAALRSYPVTEAVAAGAGQPYVVLAADHLRHLAEAPPEDDRLVITAVSPTGDHAVGDEITVHGRNFAVPASGNVVAVGGAPVVAFNPGTSDEALVLNVPAVTGVPRVAAVTVANDHGEAEWLISVVERTVVPSGEVELTEDFGDLAGQVLEEGTEVTFHWMAEAVTDHPATYTFSPVVTAATGVAAAEWLAGAAVVDEEGNPRPDVELRPHDSAGPGSGAVRVGVRLRVPSGAESADLALRCALPVAPNTPGLNRISSPVALRVGEEPEVSDPRIVFDAPTLSAGGSLADDGAILIPVGTTVRVTVTVRFEQAALTSYTARTQPDGGTWTLSNPNPAPDVQIEEVAGAEHTFGVNLQASAPDPARELRVEVTAVAPDGETYVGFQRLRLRHP